MAGPSPCGTTQDRVDFAMAAPEKPEARQREAAPTPAVKRRQRRPATLPLALAEVPDTGPATTPAISLRHLWLGVYLPALPLEALLDTGGAAAIFEEQQGVRKILLANRHAMQETFPQEIERCLASDKPVTLMMIDVDNFKLLRW